MQERNRGRGDGKESYDVISVQRASADYQRIHKNFLDEREVHMGVCVCVNLYVCLYVYVCLCVFVCLCISVCVCICVNASIYVNVCMLCTHLYVYVCVY